MSEIIVTTHNDKNEAVITTFSDLAKSKVEDTKSASGEENSQDEIIEDSEPSKDFSEDDNDDELSDSEEDEGLKDESKDDKKPKKKGGFQKRIEKFQKKLSAKDQEIEYWKKEAMKEKPSNPDQNKEKKVDLKPKAEDFDSHEDYVDALTDWKIEQKEKERDFKSKEAQIKDSYQKQVQSFQEKISEFSKTKDDFDEVISDVDDIEINPIIQEAFLTSEIGPQLMYELSKNREELERISKLNPQRALIEIGKFEERILRTSEKEIKQDSKITKAPAPLKTVGSGGSVKVAKSIYDPDLSQSEYERLRREQRRLSAY